MNAYTAQLLQMLLSLSEQSYTQLASAADTLIDFYSITKTCIVECHIYRAPHSEGSRNESHIMGEDFTINFYVTLNLKDLGGEYTLN